MQGGRFGPVSPGAPQFSTVRGFASRAPGALHLPGFLEIIPDRRQLGRTLLLPPRAEISECDILSAIAEPQITRTARLGELFAFRNAFALC